MVLQGQLPVLIVNNSSRIEGYTAISDYLSEKSTIKGVKQLLTKHEQLLNRSLISFLETKLKMIIQYNLYISSHNYEKYTRKLFKHYLPFPMMYNQPLKFFNQAQEQTATIGIGPAAGGFLSFKDPEDEIDTTTPISKLHEQTILASNKKKLSLKETKTTLRAMSLLHEYLEAIESLLETFNPKSHESSPDQELNTGEKYQELSTGEVLFYSYLNSLCFEELPDQTLHQLIKSNHSNTYEQYETVKNQFLVNPLRSPVGDELPSLYNEIKFKTGFMSTTLPQPEK